MAGCGQDDRLITCSRKTYPRGGGAVYIFVDMSMVRNEMKSKGLDDEDTWGRNKKKKWRTSESVASAP